MFQHTLFEMPTDFGTGGFVLSDKKKKINQVTIERNIWKTEQGPTHCFQNIIGKKVFLHFWDILGAI